MVTLGATVVALGQAVSAGWEVDDDWADSTAKATILDVDVYNLDDEPVPRLFDRDDGYAGYAVVDIRFTNSGDGLDDDRQSVTWMDWPDELDLPEVGDQVMIEYNAQDPEYEPRLAGSADGKPEVGVIGLDTEAAPAGAGAAAAGVMPVSSVPVENRDDEATGVTPPVRWTIAISGLLTLVSLVATVIWARRAEPAEVIGRSAGGWGGSSPPLQYSGQPQYPAQPQYSAPPQHLAHPQYSAQPDRAPQYPTLQYPTPHYPAPQAPPTQLDQPSTQGPPSGLVPPS